MQMRLFIIVMCLSATCPVAGAGDLLERVEARDVQVGGYLGGRIDMTVHNNLMKLDLDKDFLAPFRAHNASSGYTGLGKTIDAFVRFAAYTKDPEVLARKQYLVRETLALQGPDGYIGMMAPEHRMWKLWDVHEMSYIIYGLTMDYRYFNEQASLDGARRLADFVLKHWAEKPDGEPGNGELTEYMAATNIEAAMLAIHAATGDVRYLEFCTEFRKLAEWDGPIVIGRWGKIQGHAYAYLCRCLAQLRLYRMDPDARYLRCSDRALSFLLGQNGLTITGTCGQHECWHDTQEGAANLGETCATAYLIRWYDELLRLRGDARLGDLMERAIYNALFAAQSPDGRKIRYYSPIEGKRVYFDGDTYCCPSNYRRIVAELPGMIYYKAADGISVNLYSTSGTEIALRDGVKVRLNQETAYPEAGTVTLQVDPSQSARFALRLRIPAWAHDASISVNGEAAPDKPVPGTFLAVDREWKAGDVVTLEFPMKPRLVKGRVAQAGRAAVMYGPLVFCLNRAKNEALAKEDLRLITLDPSTLSGPEPDDSVHPGGLAMKVRAWRTTTWYPQAATDWELSLTEFPDPDGEAAFFHLPNPNDATLVNDELISQ